MPSNLYTIEDALVGTPYRSARVQGVIVSAEKRDDVWYDGADAYTVRIRPNVGLSDVYATIAVAN